MARILTFGAKNIPPEIEKEALKENLLKRLWGGFSSLNKSTRYFIIFTLLFLIATPFIINNYQIFRYNAASNVFIGNLKLDTTFNSIGIELPFNANNSNGTISAVLEFKKSSDPDEAAYWRKGLDLLRMDGASDLKIANVPFIQKRETGLIRKSYAQTDSPVLTPTSTPSDSNLNPNAELLLPTITSTSPTSDFSPTSILSPPMEPPSQVTTTNLYTGAFYGSVLLLESGTSYDIKISILNGIEENIIKGIIKTREDNILAISSLTPSYFVRTDGNDSNTGTSDSIEGAWKTLEKAINDAPENAIVQVDSGIFSSPVLTRSKAITLAAKYPAVDNNKNIINQNKHTIVSSGFVLQGNNIRISGFELKGSASAIEYLPSANNGIIDHNLISENATGIKLTGLNSQDSSDVYGANHVIQYNVIKGSAASDGTGIYNAGGGANVVIRYNTFNELSEAVGGDNSGFDRYAGINNDIYSNSISNIAGEVIKSQNSINLKVWDNQTENVNTPITQISLTPTPVSPSPIIQPSLSLTPTPIESGPTPLVSQPTITPIPENICILNAASWSQSEVKDGEEVTLNVTSIGNCNGKQVVFNVKKSNSLLQFGDEQLARIQPTNAQLVENKVETTWKAEYINDGSFGISNNPKYFFTANILDETSSIKSTDPDLEVSKKEISTPITPTPTVVPCELLSANWATTSAIIQGFSVGLNLNVKGNDTCNGKQVTFEVRRNGSLSIGDKAADRQPRPATIIENLASSLWLSEYDPQFPGTNVEYYFKAIVGENTITSSDPKLQVINPEGKVVTTAISEITPTPTPTPIPCKLLSASWSTKGPIKTGKIVQLNATGDNSCNNKQVTFEVRRNGLPLIGDVSVNIQPSSVRFIGDQAKGAWATEYNPQITGTDAEYYFKATVDENTIQSADPALKVKKSHRLTMDKKPEVELTSRTVIVRWRTNNDSTSEIEYGLSNVNRISDRIDRTTKDHEVFLSSLKECTKYELKVRSTDENFDEEVSGENTTIITKGCTGNATVIAQADQNISVSTGGTVSLLDNNSNGIELKVPNSFSQNDADFQIKKLDNKDVLKTVHLPGSKKLVGGQVYNLKALDSVSSIISEFDKELTVTVNY
ncbi:MAG: hypothetical protein Q7K55_07085, partial [Candidatus Levybacteria bacterium]|nr:hypothetical protein [Candidatus Levybacteria bacterium]